MPDPVADVHPRPQLTRPRWTDLGGTWSFAHDDEAVGTHRRWFAGGDPFERSIEVPFPPESPRSGVGDPGYHPVVWYRRTFRAEAVPGERLLLHLGAVDHRAQVWLNGCLVATHEGGHTPFTADLTPVLAEGGEQVVTVRAEDRPADLTQPRGKQDWREPPHDVWYERTTGIWQPVWLEPVPATRIAALRWTPDLRGAVLAVVATLAGDLVDRRDPAELRRLRVRVVLRLRGEVLADHTVAVTGERVTLRVPLDAARIARDADAYLWAPEHPNLVDATVTLLAQDAALDEVAAYAGLRDVEVRDGRFRLNGVPVVPRMVLAQNYWPQSHLAAPDGEALRREVELVRELGFTGVRIHQKIEDPRFLHWCSVLGVLAWEELPSAQEFGPGTVARLVREWSEAVERDAGVPAVVAWVPFNESWGVPQVASDPAQQDAVRALYALTRALDPTRPVVANDGWEYVTGDVVGVHDYTQDAEVLRERYGTAERARRTLRAVQPGGHPILVDGADPGDAPLMVTEFGGTTYDPGAGDSWNGYGAVGSAQALLDRYADLAGALLASPAVAGFCWTQLTDTAQERNGLLDADRRPKVDPAAVAAVNRRPAAAEPGDTPPAPPSSVRPS